MRIDILTIFPELIKPYLEGSILGRAQAKDLLDFNLHDLRSYTTDKHRQVDDTPYGGGAGMVLKIEPIYNCLQQLPHLKSRQVFLLTPAGETLTQTKVQELATYQQLVLICGRYEGVDARVDHFIDGKLSVGPYVLAGGEIAALTVTETVSRLVPGVLGNKDSLSEETFSLPQQQAEYPQYTRPASFKTDDGQVLDVPEVLQSGNHQDIKSFRNL